MKNYIKVLIIVFGVIFLLSACGTKQTQNTSTEKEKDDVFTIVTSFYPMYIHAINITRNMDDVKVVNMTQPQTGCLHDYSLTTENLKTLETANVFVVNGGGMEAFMEKVTQQLPDLDIVEASKGIQLIANEHKEENPHVWVSIAGAIQQVENITEQMCELDKENAEKYKNNSQNYLEKLKKLSGDMHSALDGIENKKIVTFHEAFPYFAKEFELDIVAVVEREPGSEPSAGELKETIDIIKEVEVKVLFAEPQYPVKAADTIANETVKTLTKALAN